MSKLIADFQTQLSSKLSIGDTSISIQNNVDNDGNILIAGYYYFTLNGGETNKEYIYAKLEEKSLTEIQSVSRQGVKTEGASKEHRYGSTVTITNFASIMDANKILKGEEGLDADNPIKYDEQPIISDDKEIVTKKDVDDLEIGDPSIASDEILGASKVSVAPADASNPILLGDNDERIPTQNEKDAMEGSYGTPSTSNKFATEDHSALDNNVNLEDDQEVAGIKTFTSIPVLPGNPTEDNQLANKAYADSLLS